MEDTNLDLSIQEEDISVHDKSNPEAETGDTQATEVEKSGATKKSPNHNKKFLRLPLARVKHMIKQDPDVKIIGQDAVFLVAKATEMFIEFMSKKAADQIVNTKRKTVLKRDVEVVVNNVPNLCFLDGTLE
ncbi:DNA polymerase epsilon subunit 4 [Aethina tumida]|uniref:DNA polymerase epsilon subunit 4 n=1 Tax=Aethina tumida TaxID=116153 RepID=UPI00096B3D22|nr:DNA polymerase epsilon subunit 4 [Aethina tumida]